MKFHLGDGFVVFFVTPKIRRPALIVICYKERAIQSARTASPFPNQANRITRLIDVT